jgi:hypothetical protein
MKSFNPTLPVSRPTAKKIMQVLGKVEKNHIRNYETYSEIAVLAYQLNVWCKQNKQKFAEVGELEFGQRSTAYLYSKVGKALIEKFGKSDDFAADVKAQVWAYVTECHNGTRKMGLNDFHAYLTGKQGKAKDKVENLLEIKVNAAGEIEVKAAEGIDADKIAEIIRKQLSAKLGA